MSVLQLSACRFLTVAATLAVCGPAYAGPIAQGDWLQFSFTNAGVTAKGCAPADPSGDFCIASSGTPTTFLDTPPWTFSSLVPTVLTVTDAFLSGDRFSILDFNIAVGETSNPASGVDCGDDPVICAGTPGMSTGAFFLAAGSHSLTIVPTLSSGGGSGYLRVDAVPEPATGALFGLSLAFLMWSGFLKGARL